MNDFANEDALVLFSRTDSTTCLYWAKKHFHDAHTVCFFMGMTFTGSGKCTTYCRNGQVSFQVLDTPIISQLAPTRLPIFPLKWTKKNLQIPIPTRLFPGATCCSSCAAAIAYAKISDIL